MLVSCWVFRDGPEKRVLGKESALVVNVQERLVKLKIKAFTARYTILRQLTPIDSKFKGGKYPFSGRGDLHA
jgi:hypothetical protein